jgi:hypothetical protein
VLNILLYPGTNIIIHWVTWSSQVSPDISQRLKWDWCVHCNTLQIE